MQKRLTVSTELICQILRKGTPNTIVTSPLPDDAKIINARYDQDADAVELLIESESFIGHDPFFKTAFFRTDRLSS